MSDESVVNFVGGRAVEQIEAPDSNLADDEREVAKKAVREALQKAGKESAEDAKSSRGKDPFKPAGTKKDSEKDETDGDDAGKQKPGPKKASRNEADDDGGPVRGPDGKFVSKGSESKDGGASDTDSKSKSTEADSEDDDDDDVPEDLDKASVKQLLKAREKVAQVKKQAQQTKAEVENYQRQMQALQAQQQEFYRQQAELQRQAQALAALRNDPARAVKEAGYDPEQFILDLAQEGTPEGRLRRQIQEQQRQIQEMHQWRQQVAQQQQAWMRQQQEQAVAQERERITSDFVSKGMSEDKYPHVAAFYKGNERALVAFGDIVAQEYRNLSSGKEAGLEDILDYIESELAKRAKRMYTNSVKATSVPGGNQTKSKGKALSPDMTGERRASRSGDLTDLDGDERIEAAKQAVAVALANSR